MIFLILFPLIFTVEVYGDETPARFEGAPCTSSEKWAFSSAIEAEYRASLHETAASRGNPILAFADALEVRRRGYTEATKATAEYFISRSLYTGGLPHVARLGFEVILRREPTPEIVSQQLASLGCLMEIEAKTNSMELTDFVSAERISLWKTAAGKNPSLEAILRQAAYHRIVALLRRARSQEAGAFLSTLEKSSIEARVSNAWIAAAENKHSEVISSIAAADAIPAWPTHVERMRSELVLQKGRSLFSLGRYKDSITAFRSISRSSNWLAQSLSDLAWAQLQAEQLNDAIGTGIVLRTGAMRQTYTPEASMIVAMAFNELCHFPESLKSVQQFRKEYASSYEWLKQWSNQRSEMYPAVVSFLKARGRAPASNSQDLPTRVGTELLRSPIFITRQDELNLLIDEKERSAALMTRGAETQLEVAKNIASTAKQLGRDIVAVRKKLGEEDPLPEDLRARLASFRKLIHRYWRVKAAAGPWKSILASHENRVSPLRTRLKKEIESDLISRAEKMRIQLEEIAENNQLIEIEILNGASQDIVWQNANPSFKKLERSLASVTEARKEHSQGKVQNWGKSAIWDGAEDAEVWEDELGAFKADLSDKCSNKDRYLAIKRGGN